MKKRYAVLGLSLFLALALAVPALGGPTNPVASISAGAKSIAQKALKKAKAAQQAANNAQATANSASSAASAASSAAAKAQKAAEGAQGTANTAKASADSAKAAADAAQSTADSAKALAETKMSGEEHFEGTEGSTLSVAACQNGKVPTGGGFIITGANNNAATVTESTQYLNGWIVIADQIEGTSGSTWGTIATVNCATSP
jgi:membrane protein involved in colicin uptake